MKSDEGHHDPHLVRASFSILLTDLVVCPALPEVRLGLVPQMRRSARQRHHGDVQVNKRDRRQGCKGTWFNERGSCSSSHYLEV